MNVKEESEKVDLKLNIWKTKIVASGTVTSWQMGGETVSDFIFWGSKNTADGDFSHEIKRHLLLGRKVMTDLDSILRNRDVADKGLSSHIYGFSSCHVWIWQLDYKKKFNTEELILLSCGVSEYSWESGGLEGDQVSQS